MYHKTVPVNHLSAIRSFSSGWSLKRRLFGYMLLLASLLLLVVMTGLFLFGQFNSAEKNTFNALDMQMEVFEKDIETHFDSIAAAGIALSENMTDSLESYLNTMGLDFDDLNDNPESILQLQNILIDPLVQQLMREDCSGVFLMLDATVNTFVEYADVSRTGLYLQTNGYASIDNSILLYRGSAEIAKEHGIMPHRKWHLEFRTDLFPNYDDICNNASRPADRTYRFTDVVTLPGTTDKVMLLTVPMTGSDGTFYGICGLEISSSYFMAYHAQPTKIQHLTCLLSPGSTEYLNTFSGFSCGEADGYYRVPQGKLTAIKVGNSLSSFTSDDIQYVGLTRYISISHNNEEYVLGVMMRKNDYDAIVRKNNILIVTLWVLLLSSAVSCCYYFSRRFLSPILRSLEHLKTDELASLPYDLPEITDLFEFLSQKDIEHEESLTPLEQEKQAVQKEKDSLLQEYEKIQQEYEKSKNEVGRTQMEFEKAQEELARLAYSRQAEIDPDAYAQFLDGIELLTRTERRIFDYYLAGLGIKEISETLQVKESTIYSHNKNIYSKLGINSLKQLLRYAALMRQQEKEAAGLA